MGNRIDDLRKYRIQTMSSWITGRTDDLRSHIGDLDRSTTDLMTQAGVEELMVKTRSLPHRRAEVCPS